MSRRRVVITGLGPITCIGKGVDGFWNGILAEKTGISKIENLDVSQFGVRVAGQIHDWDPEEFFPTHRLKRLDRYAQFSVASVKLALEDSGLNYSPDAPHDRGRGATPPRSACMRPRERGTGSRIGLRYIAGSGNFAYRKIVT